MNGAYGVKVVEQATYVADALSKDQDSRQAVINIWRERPAQSKDIPCTLNMQFLIRDGKLHAVVNMRSQDAVLGFSYDVFTFSAVAGLIRVLLKERGTDVELGYLHVHVGSLHLYEQHFDKADEWIDDVVPDSMHNKVLDDWQNVLKFDGTPHSYCRLLKALANDYS